MSSQSAEQRRRLKGTNKLLCALHLLNYRNVLHIYSSTISITEEILPLQKGTTGADYPKQFYIVLLCLDSHFFHLRLNNSGDHVWNCLCFIVCFFLPAPIQHDRYQMTRIQYQLVHLPLSNSSAPSANSIIIICECFQ